MGSRECVIIGGGPAGLTAAYELGKLGRRAIVLEAGSVVGGLSRTSVYKGYRFDAGGHRFFTKVEYVKELWDEILGDQFLSRARLSRIFYRGKLFDYPLKPVNALRGLGVAESARVLLSYAYALLVPLREERTFEQWVVNRFGRRLYEIFFKTYTEKVWGMPCSEIGAEWAAQRIKNLDLATAVRNALAGSRTRRKETVTTLIDRFHYPRYGPGQLWNRCAELVSAQGSEVRLNAPVVRLAMDGDRMRAAVVRNEGVEEEVQGEEFFASIPIRTLLRSMDPPPPEDIAAAGARLRYRDFITVALIVGRADLFPDNWIYVHSSDVKVGRIQNYKNWSPDMVPDPSKTALGLEYFVQEGDGLWNSSDEELIALATAEIEHLGLVPPGAVEDGTVLRIPKAYPVYDEEYWESLRTIRRWLERFPNLQLIGRNGQHRYNNQDHSMMTGVYAARNATGATYDIWSVNVEQEYHEERAGSGDRLVPTRAQGNGLDSLIRQAFAVYDPIALGFATGIVLGAGLFLATAIILLAAQAEPAGPNLSLLNNYFPGYSVTWKGAFLALVEAGGGGYTAGWALAMGINALIERERCRLLRGIEDVQRLAVPKGIEA